jgi:hypothetical protein
VVVLGSREVKNNDAASASAEIDPRVDDRDLIRDAVRPDMDEHKHHQSSVRRFLDRLKRVLRW